MPPVKYDPVTDNKILTDAGLAPLTEPQMKPFNEFYCWSIRWASKGGQDYHDVIQNQDKQEERKKIFDAADTDSDGLLNKVEMISVLKQLLSGPYHNTGYEWWHTCIASVSAETGESCSFEDFSRMQEVLSTWAKDMSKAMENMANSTAPDMEALKAKMEALKGRI